MKKPSLIIVDMQNDFIDGSLGNENAEAIVPEIVALIEGGSYKNVFVTLDTHDEGYMDTQEGSNLPIIHCVKGTEGHRLRKEIDDAIRKHYPSRFDGMDWERFDPSERKSFFVEKRSFGTMDWHRYVGSLSDEIHIVGTCTDICLVSNALILKAMFPERRIAVIEYACAGTSEENHDAALKTMASCQIEIIGMRKEDFKWTTKK